MADDLYSLLISAEGGDEASREILKSKGAMTEVEGESDHLKNKFQEGFQHVALKGFLTDAGRSIGLGTELRPIISLLNAGITELGAAFGIATGGAGLLLTGLAALAGLAVVVYEHFNKHAEALTDLAEKQATALKTTDDLKESLLKYAAVVGILPENLKKLKDATDALDESQRKQLNSTVGKLDGQAEKDRMKAVVDLQTAQERLTEAQYQYTAALGTNEESRRTSNLREAEKAVGDLKDKIVSADGAIAKGNADIAARAKGYADAKDMADKLGEAAKTAAEKATKAEDENFRHWNAGIDQQIKQEEEFAKKYEQSAKAVQSLSKLTTDIEDQGAESTRNAYQKKQAEITKYIDDKAAEIAKLYEVALTEAQTDAQRAAAFKQMTDATQALQRTADAKTRENYTEQGQEAIKLGQTIKTSVADAVAKSIVEQKSMGDAFRSLSKQIAETLISDSIKWGIQSGVDAAKTALGYGEVGAAAGTSSAAQVTASAAVTAAIHAQTLAVVALSAALKEATVQALALDAALVVVAA